MELRVDGDDSVAASPEVAPEDFTRILQTQAEKIRQR